MPHQIYTLTDPRTETVRYVGMSTYAQRRHKEHIANSSGLKDKWIQELKYVGILPTLAVIDEAETVEEARVLETFWIRYFQKRGIVLLNVIQGSLAPEDYEWCLDRLSLYHTEYFQIATQFSSCIIQGRFQDISIKQLAQVELLLTVLARNYAFDMCLVSRDEERIERRKTYREMDKILSQF